MTATHGVVLAAGLSSRFGSGQKALHLLDGRSLLDRSLDLLAAAGVDSLAVVCGHRAADVEAALGSREDRSPVVVVANDRFERWNNFYSVELACRSCPPGDLLVVNGDVVYTAQALAAVLDGPSGDLRLAVADEPFDEEAMKTSVRDGLVTRLGKGLASDEAAGEFIGISKLTPTARTWYVALSGWGRRHGLTGIYYEEVFDGLCGALEATACPVSPAGWAEIDEPGDLERALAVVRGAT